jgi:hypothetical protein
MGSRLKSAAFNLKGGLAHAFSKNPTTVLLFIHAMDLITRYEFE